MHRFDGLAPLCYVRLCLSSKAVTTFFSLKESYHKYFYGHGEGSREYGRISHY